jgi:hypothetical protein
MCVITALAPAHSTLLTPGRMWYEPPMRVTVACKSLETLGAASRGPEAQKTLARILPERQMRAVRLG